MTAGKVGDGHRERVTIRQVAALAGVSIATVSRVVNGHADVSDATRETVQRVISEHGYRAFPRGRPAPTGLISVTMPFVQSGYFGEILSGAAEALYEQDMQVVLCPTRHSRARELSLLDRLSRVETDGAVLVLPDESSEELQALAGQGFPFVVVDPLTDVAEGIPVVCAAHSSGAAQATRHLLESGHRRIAAITGPAGWLATEQRLSGYHGALAGAGVLPDPGLVVAADFRVAARRRNGCSGCPSRPRPSSPSMTAWPSARCRPPPRSACGFPGSCPSSASTTPPRPPSPSRP